MLEDQWEEREGRVVESEMLAGEWVPDSTMMNKGA